MIRFIIGESKIASKLNQKIHIGVSTLGRLCLKSSYLIDSPKYTYLSRKVGSKKQKRSREVGLTHPTGFSLNNFFFNMEASANDWYFLDYKSVFHFCHVVHTNQYHFSFYFFLSPAHIPSTIYRLEKIT